MQPEVQLVFSEVADLSPAERDRYFEERKLPADLRAEVESLLRFDVTRTDSIGDHIARTAEQLLNSEATPREDERCGPYQLLRLLGQGGMGAVFLAQRTDGELEQRVAIKFVRHAAQDPGSRDRFLRERQILASLSHPGIARLLDAGHTPSGQPYLVMEHIDGTPIDVYCNVLDLRGKLGIFLRVADAVSYAHRNLVIHRDLKPSNILVEAGGAPKLLDFGIARIVDQTIDRAATQYRLLTPDYASPEQVRGDARSTATDVYSLGAVLYRLVTGKSPHAPGEGRPESVEEIICSSEPMPPSRVNPALPKDLDFILAKALRKQPEDRYAAVDALADDIRALLEARPVRARSDSTWYRASKFLRRHWLPVSTAALALVCLLAGLYAANHQRTIAQRRFQQLRQLANRMLVFDSSIRGLPGSTKARQEIVSASMEYLEGLGREASGDMDLARDVANGYLQLARVQGIPNSPNLGQPGAADQSLRKAESFIDTVLKSAPTKPDSLLLAAAISHDRMILADSESHRDDALVHARQCANRLDQLLESGTASQEQKVECTRLYLNVGLAHMNMHRYDDAVRYARRGMEMARSVGSSRHYGSALSLLANALRVSGDLDGALQSISEARKLAESTRYATETERGLALYGVLLRQGWILGEADSIALNRPAEAIEPLQKAFDLMEQLASKDAADAVSRDRLVSAARLLGDNLRVQNPERAMAVYDIALKRIREVREGAKANREEARLLAHSTYALRQLHREAEAGSRITIAVELLRMAKDYPAPEVILGEPAHYVLRALAEYQAGSGHPEQALATYRDLLDRVMASKPQPESDLRQANDLALIYLPMSRLYRLTGEVGQAESLEARYMELWRGWNRKLPNNPFVLRRLSENLTASR